MSKKTVNFVERNIYFYRAIVDAQRIPLLALRADDVATQIEALPFDKTARKSRYYQDPEGGVFMCWPSTIQNRQRFKFARNRAKDAPPIEKRGKLRAVPITADEHLVETLHCVVFPNNIVGTVFNLLGPRMTHVTDYFKAKTSVHHSVAFEALVQPDVEHRLDRLGGIRVLEMKLHPDEATLFEGHDSNLDDAMNALRRVGDARTISVQLNAGTKQGASLGNNVLEAVRALLRRAPIQAAAEKFVLKGPDKYTGQSFDIDLLSADFVLRKTIRREAGESKAIDADAAFQAIEEAYAEIRTNVPSVEIIQ